MSLRSKPILFNCSYCGKQSENWHWVTRQFCSFKCSAQSRIPKTVEELKTDKSRRNFITKLNGHFCDTCGISEWRGKKIGLELDHVDGNHTNNVLSNLRLLCPNCHSQTDTYKNKNAGKGRESRRKRYADIAQLKERLTCNENVVGLIPTIGSNTP